MPGRLLSMEQAGALVNGVPPARGIPGLNTVNRDITSAKDGVPELTHITEGYQSLAKLFQRVAQDTFNSLEGVISDLQDTRRITNGDSHFKPQDHSKRLRWLDFANDHRQRFLKLYVLLQWARGSREPIGRLVDVVSWMHENGTADEQTHEAVGLLKRELVGIKVPNPDIKTAHEILALGQSSRFPDVGIPHCLAYKSSYDVTEPLPASRLITELKNLDTILHIRLNLYENLPRHLQNFSIASGRVTFTIPGEFAVDLSLLGDEPDARFFFVDLRFLFSPTLDVPTGQIRLELEVRVNAILAADGLAGCFNFLHDFCLTYKLSVLRRQAIDLNQGSWEGSLRIERIHRTLMIQYWKDRAAKKSWLEIGIVGFGAADKAALVVKWTRQGKVIESGPLNQVDLNIEQLLINAVERHASSLLDLAGAVRLTSTKRATLHIERITGRFGISPISTTSLRTEEILNDMKDPIAELAPRIKSWQLRDAVVTFQQEATTQGWQSIRLNIDSAAKRRVFDDPDASPILVKRWDKSDWVIAALPNEELAFDVWILEISNEIHLDSSGCRILLSQKIEASGAIKEVLVKIGQVSTSFVSTIVNERQAGVVGLQLKAKGVSIMFPVEEKALQISALPGLKVQTLATGQLSFGKSLQAISALKLPGANIYSSGSFELHQQVPLGDAVMELVCSQARQIYKVQECLKVIEKAKLPFEQASLESIDIIYAPSLSIMWPLQSKGKIALRPAHNPHRRILHLLRLAPSAETLPTVLSALMATLPLLQVFEALEGRGGVLASPTTLTHYALAYTRPRVTLNIQFKHNKSASGWYVSYESPRNLANQKLVDALSAYFCTGDDERIIRLQTGAFAFANGVSDLITALDVIIRACLDLEPDVTNALPNADAPNGSSTDNLDKPQPATPRKASQAKPSGGSAALARTKSQAQAQAKPPSKGTQRKGPEVVVLD